MRSLVDIARQIYRLRFKVKWYNQYRNAIKKNYFYHEIELLPIRKLKKVLIVAPHADDEWIGASCVIRNAEQVEVLYMEYYGDNYSLSNISIRQKELLRSSVINKFKLQMVCQNSLSSMVHDLLKSDYTAIFIPSPLDWHPEHRETFKLFAETYLQDKETFRAIIYLYNITVPHQDISDMLVMAPMTKSEQIFKWERFMKVYPSQNMPVYRLKLQERLNANSNGCYAAEIFEIASKEILSKWLCFLKNGDNADLLNSYKYKINDILSIREEIFENAPKWD